MSKFALAAVAALAATAVFPLTLRLRNETWRDAVEPETATVVPPYSFAPITFTSADQLKRVESNVEVHNAVNLWQPPAGLFLCSTEDIAEPAPAPLVESVVADAGAAVGLVSGQAADSEPAAETSTVEAEPAKPAEPKPAPAAGKAGKK